MRSALVVRSFHILSFLLHFLLHGVAQNQSVGHECMVWTEAIAKIGFQERYGTTLLYQHRLFLGRPETYQDILWVSLDGKVGKSFALSAGFIYFNYHRNSGSIFLSVPEYRPFQAATFTRQINRVRLSFRFMVEERYMKRADDGELLEGHDFNMRYRSRFQAMLPLGDRLELELSDEYLLNGRQMEVELFAQNRAIFRMHYKLPMGTLNIGYMDWLVNASSELQHRHSVLIGVRHRW